MAGRSGSSVLAECGVAVFVKGAPCPSAWHPTASCPATRPTTALSRSRSRVMPRRDALGTPGRAVGAPARYEQTHHRHSDHYLSRAANQRSSAGRRRRPSSKKGSTSAPSPQAPPRQGSRGVRRRDHQAARSRPWSASPPRVLSWCAARVLAATAAPYPHPRRMRCRWSWARPDQYRRHLATRAPRDEHPWDTSGAHRWSPQRARRLDAPRPPGIREGQTHPTTQGESRPENVRVYLQLARLLDGIQQEHPEVSAPLRLTLLGARRDGQIGCLDQSRFRAVVAGVSPAQPSAHGDDLLSEHRPLASLAAAVSSSRTTRPTVVETPLTCGTKDSATIAADTPSGARTW